MSDGELGFTEAVSIALGGMIGGGIYAVLGVVAKAAGSLAWLSFLGAGVIVLCAGYSFVRLNRLTDGKGGAVTYIEELVGNSTVAGMVGWALLVGYVGSMSLYAFAFGSYAVGMIGTQQILGLPLRPLLSVACVAGFVALVAGGAAATGKTEDLLVGVKMLILILFAAGGLYYGFLHGSLDTGLSSVELTGPVMAAAVSFVAFQGWELLFYDQDAIMDHSTKIPLAVYVSIPVATLVYVGIAFVTTSLVPQLVRTQPETALAVAAEQFSGHVGHFLISASALFSTGSAINSTLFSSSYFANNMVGDDLLPDQIGDDKMEGVPVRTVVVLGGLAAGFAVLGSLNAISSFASVSFIVVFGAMNLLALSKRDSIASSSTLVPFVGTVGSVAFLPLLLYRLYTQEPRVFGTVVALSVAVVLAELLYFERDVIKEEAREIEEKV